MLVISHVEFGFKASPRTVVLWVYRKSSLSNADILTASPVIDNTIPIIIVIIIIIHVFKSNFV